MKKHTAGKTLWEIFRQGQTPLIFMVMVSLTPLIISYLAEKHLALCLILLVLNLGLLVTLCVIIGKTTGEKHYKAKIANAARLRYAAEHGEEADSLRPDLEYKPWKGFAIGFAGNWAMFLLVILYACLAGTRAGESVEAVIVLIFGVFQTIPVTIDAGASVYWVLFGALVTTVSTGAGYLLGGRKQMLLQAKIDRREEEIYGKRS